MSQITHQNRHLFPLATLLSAVLVAFCLLPQASRASGQKPLPRVTATTAVVMAFEQKLNALGSLSSNQHVTITPQINGRIAELKLKDGAQVSRGSQLVLLDNREQKAKVNSARISLADKERQFAYMNTLFKRQAISRDELEAQQAQVEMLRASLTAEEAILDYYTLTAPFDGVLGFNDVSQGMLINTGTEITTLDDLSRMKLTFELPENTLSLIAQGTRITATTDAWPDQVFSGVVDTINPRIDAVNLTFKVRALLDNPGHRLRPGMLMRIDVQRPQNEALVVPSRSVLFSGNDRFVYVIDEQGMAWKREIATGLTLDDKIVILEGLAPGETIIDEGVIKVTDGRQVSITPSPTMGQLAERKPGPIIAEEETGQGDRT